MKEGLVFDAYRTRDEDEAAGGGFTASAAFPALVALWFAALFGGGCLFLPPVLFDMVFGGEGPFGPNTRIIVALGAAGIGLLMGLFIASRVRGGAQDREEPAPAPRRKRGRKGKRDARQPLDVRAALGLDPDDDDDDDEVDAPARENDEYELSDETIADDVPGMVKPPIDDPYFASAWSDSDSYDRPEAAHDELGDADWGRSPLPEPEDFRERASHIEEWEMDPPPQPAQSQSEPRPQPQQQSAQPGPSRYNPFAQFVRADETAADDPHAKDVEEEIEGIREDRLAHGFVQDPAPRPDVHRSPSPEPEPRRATAPPPPPAWPTPRADEPKLTDLGVAELVERLARALQGQEHPDTHEQPEAPSRAPEPFAPPRSGGHRHESALAPRQSQETDVDRALRGALDRLARLDDVA